MGAKNLKLTGNKSTILNSLCNHLGIDYGDNCEVSEDDTDTDSDKSFENHSDDD